MPTPFSNPSPSDQPPPSEKSPLSEAQRREQSVARWVALMEACEQFLLAGLRQRIGPGGDLRAAYREWYARQMEEHDRMMIHMIEEFNRRSREHAK